MSRDDTISKFEKPRCKNCGLERAGQISGLHYVRIEESKWLNAPGLLIEPGGAPEPRYEETYRLLGELTYFICDDCLDEHSRGQKKRAWRKTWRACARIVFAIGGSIAYFLFWFGVVGPFVWRLFTKEAGWASWAGAVVAGVTIALPIIAVLGLVSQAMKEIFIHRVDSRSDFAWRIFQREEARKLGLLREEAEEPTVEAEPAEEPHRPKWVYSYESSSKGDIIYLTKEYFDQCVAEDDIVKYAGGGPLGSR